MRFKIVPEGETVSGRTYADIVKQMAARKMESATSLDRYRQMTAERVSEIQQVIIDSSSDESFVKSLEAAGLLVRQ